MPVGIGHQGMIASARLVKRCTADGLVSARDEVPLGKMYLVQLETEEEVELLNTTHGVLHKKRIIFEAGTGQWLPVEMLEIERSQDARNGQVV